MNEKQKLKKELGLFDVYAIATGTTLSAGFSYSPAWRLSRRAPL
jgi:hypothetical protein